MGAPRSLLIAASLFSAGSFAATADFPTKPVRVIVPFAPGAAADAVTRVVAKKLTDYWGKQVILDNRPGVPGVQVAANAPPDGYSMLLGAGSNIVTSPLMMAKAPYDPQKDLTPVSLVVNIPPILTTHPSLGVKNVKELIALAKRKPGELNYSSSGMGAPNHLAMELFTLMTGTKMVHVPYKGAAPSVIDMIAGQVQLGFNAIPSVLQHVQSGKLTAIAVSSAKRASALPKLPTINESGVPGFEYNIWYGLFVPSKTPPDLVAKLSNDVQRALKEPDVVQQLLAQGTEPAPSTSAALAQYIKEDTARWSRIIRERNIKLE